MQRPDSMQKLARGVFIATSLLLIMAGGVWGIRLHTMVRTQPTVVQPTNNAIGGFPMSGGLAPDFRLIDQFGHPFTFSSLHGHEVVLSFIDSRCTSLCPLTANIMYDAKARLGSSASSQIVLVAVNANPVATSITEVQTWSINHGMLHQWLFLTGTARQLQAVYRLYGIYDQVSTGGAIIHDPEMLIIDAQGHERLYYETLDSNAKADLNSEIVGLADGMQQWLPKA